MIYDKIFIIHLERERFRKENIMQQFQKENITDYEFIRAVDGQNDNLEKYNISVIPDWVEPYSSKIMTKGEIGCSLSHYNVWKRIVEEELNNALILEDDIVLCDHFSQNIEKKREEISNINYDLLYLGRTPLKPETQTDPIIIPKYSYGTHAYILSLSGAKKLLNSNYLQNLLPVDEFLNILYDDKYPHKEYIHYFENAPRMKVFSLNPLLIEVLHGNNYKSTTYSSDPYVSVQNVYNLLIIILTSDIESDPFLRLIRSCEIYGHSYKIIRENKDRLLKQELLSWSDKELEKNIIVITDPENTIINANPKEIIQKYKTDKILFSSKKSNWPIRSETSLVETLTEYKYLDSDLFIGNAKQILDMISIDKHQDLHYYTNIYANKEVSIDFNCEIFQTITHKSIEDIDILFFKSRIKNKITSSIPCIYTGIVF